MNELLFPPQIDLSIADMTLSADHLDIFVQSNREKAQCPHCQTVSQKIHGIYSRYPQDLPCFNRSVQLHIQVNRFRCDHSTCPHKTFAERFPNWLEYKARRTERLQENHLAVAYCLSGEAGRHLLTKLKAPISGDTLIRDIRGENISEDTNENIKPKIIGIDDWASKRGRQYGTIIVDLEKQKPIDLLDTRESEVVADWLKNHPEIEIVSRDRSKEYAKAITIGAPQAQQVADRWHLLKNLREAIEKYLRQNPTILKNLATTMESIPTKTSQDLPKSSQTTIDAGDPIQKTAKLPMQKAEKQNTKLESDMATRQARREERFEKVNQLYKAGYSQRTIASKMKIARKTVLIYLEADECPQYARGRIYPSKLEPWLPYLELRWQAGYTNATGLWREICVKGFDGGRGIVSRWAVKQRSLLPKEQAYKRQQPDGVSPSLIRQTNPVPWSAQRASWLFVLDECQLTDEEKDAWQMIKTTDSLVKKVDGLVRQFINMVKERKADRLNDWLNNVLRSDIGPLKGFARGIFDDLQAVYNALDMKWSNGQTEGQVNRLKFLKRQMFGRANFDLLRKKVLYQPA